MTKGTAHRTLAASLGLVGIASLILTSPAPHAAPRPKPEAGPQNVVVILTDDQRFSTLKYMPNVQRLLVDRGLRFSNAFDNNPLCCPARTTLMTGLTSGHSGVWWNANGPNGGYQAFLANGDQDKTVFDWFHAAGYRTGFVGKFLNGYAVSDASWILPGVDYWQPFLIDETTDTPCEPDGYFGTCYSNNGVLETHPTTDYSTTTSGDKAVSFIESTPKGQPLLLYYAPRAPHLPTLPESTYATACPTLPPITGPSYNTTITNGPAYETSKASIGPKRQAVQQENWRNDCRTLLSVDDQVGRIVHSLNDTGRMGNTLIMFVSDNGYMFGEHRWVGKLVPYEESIRVPLVIRDDAAIQKGMQGTTSDIPVSNLDFAPTLLRAAGLAALTQSGLDGQSLFPILKAKPGFTPESNILIEHQGGIQVPAYCGVRAPGWMYARYSTGEEELYNLAVDPFELTNVAGDPAYASQLADERAAAEAACVPTPPGFTWNDANVAPTPPTNHPEGR